MAQKTEEAFKTSDKTLLDANLDNSIKQCEMRQRWASGLIQMVENVIQPNPGNYLLVRARYPNLAEKTLYFGNENSSTFIYLRACV